jgi:hypothetical protein
METSKNRNRGPTIIIIISIITSIIIQNRFVSPPPATPTHKPPPAHPVTHTTTNQTHNNRKNTAHIQFRPHRSFCRIVGERTQGKASSRELANQQQNKRKYRPSTAKKDLLIQQQAILFYWEYPASGLALWYPRTGTYSSHNRRDFKTPSEIFNSLPPSQ